ncbi:BlaI/MecI/CopY family transcriptional regulator [Streptomyces sp. H27-G5]|uniref:BlaI/MecI/CopY family transcriptional regulator n=1 Tax=Streptomyces sp. H27-G5 TaxID=2996698 RepID=UPI00227197A9|nr:BlaI/MecI/CopY family transcriptional regulator [Streptomyces sp. H27-G5]MCY0919510.1 BlaI/MecI/CopY family transcriptional regulator [Streptomyces sp. H27-G5]
MNDHDEGGAAGPHPSRRRAQGQLEAQVLAALGESPEAATAGWVQERIGGGIAYTTVITILTRLHDKGAVERERSGRSFRWTPVADGAGLATWGAAAGTTVSALSSANSAVTLICVLRAATAL